MMLNKVLVVDDSLLIHQMYRLLLARYQCEIVYATNGKQALEVLERQKHFELIILDINMPVMNGVQFLEKAAASGIPEKIPIIVISTEGKEDDTIRSLTLGARGYLRKPFTQSDFHKLINNIVRPTDTTV